MLDHQVVYRAASEGDECEDCELGGGARDKASGKQRPALYTWQFVCKREKNTDIFHVEALLSVSHPGPGLAGADTNPGHQSDQRGGMGVGGASFCFPSEDPCCLYTKVTRFPVSGFL